MHTHQLRRALVCAIAGALAAGALAGPAMAASDAAPDAPEGRKAGADQHEYLTVRKSGSDPIGYIIGVRKSGGMQPAFVTVPNAGGDPIGYIIGVL
jgi:hypothetical protein